MPATTTIIKRLYSLPEAFPYPWTEDWGEDNFGLYMALAFNGVTQYFRWIEPGEFKMGSPQDETERLDREHLHQVRITKGFWMADTACTQELWKAVIGENPAHFKGTGLPVEQVSWEDCIGFVNKVQPYFASLQFRLPHEAEWEYACRAGTTTPFSFGNNITPEQVNYNGSVPYAEGKKGLNREKTIPVQSLPPNPWGLYEMHGNVWEWCADWYDAQYYQTSPEDDPPGPDAGKGRVVRGGSWFYYGRSVRSAVRNRNSPDYRINFLGFRLVCSSLPLAAAGGQKKKEKG